MEAHNARHRRPDPRAAQAVARDFLAAALPDVSGWTSPRWPPWTSATWPGRRKPTSGSRMPARSPGPADRPARARPHRYLVRLDAVLNVLEYEMEGGQRAALRHDTKRRKREHDYAVGTGFYLYGIIDAQEAPMSRRGSTAERSKRSRRTGSRRWSRASPPKIRANGPTWRPITNCLQGWSARPCCRAPSAPLPRTKSNCGKCCAQNHDALSINSPGSAARWK